MKILQENCNPEIAEDRSLPYNAFLVEYEIDKIKTYDLVISDKKVELFDYYWDKYREGLKGWKQSEGRINPKLWGIPKKEEKKKK